MSSVKKCTKYRFYKSGFTKLPVGSFMFFFCFIENVYFYQFGFDQTLNTVKGRKTHMSFYSVTFKLKVEFLFSYLRTPSPTRHESGHLHGVIRFPSLVIHFYRRKGWWCCGVFQGTGKGCGWCSGTSCRRFG